MLPPPPPRPPHEVPRGDDNARSSMDFFRKKHRKPGILHWQKPGKNVENLYKFACTTLDLAHVALRHGPSVSD